MTTPVRRLATRWARAGLLSLSIACGPAGFGQGINDRTYASAPIPAGLSAVWRVDGRKLDARASAWSVSAFSTDGRYVGVSDDTGTRVYRADDGRLVRMLPAPFATGQFTFSLAISATGLVALGRVGGVELHALEGGHAPLTFHCAGVCGPVSAVAFSPNGGWLAYQAGRGGLEPAPGLVNVVDLGVRRRVVELEASATRAGVMFAADGRTLLAANVTRIDDVGTFGLRSWNGAAEWRRTRDVRGALAPRGSIGPYAFNERVAIYQRDGLLELREVATGQLVWAVALASPDLDTVGTPEPLRLDLVAFEPRSSLVLSFESPDGGTAPGAIVLRRMSDGETLAIYDVVGVSSLAFAPDGGSFVYSTGAGRTYTALARVPR